MRRQHLPESPVRLLPAGRRWGFGAHSVLPYLSLSLQSRPGEGGEAIRNPVFRQMDATLPPARKRH
ncbi:MAG TPA: hypothetical protein VFM98_18930 [Ramlibacter sp.]|uniref:hypothetical protein n=1 Tax=Ramlibacter sp. TaxID=1917967 RepID=UPI002D7EE674|nr:hypothetical protein [Ramlibacter sp.]HET8747681.1 hypothetical protein [Ramlibacter sp.]